MLSAHFKPIDTLLPHLRHGRQRFRRKMFVHKISESDKAFRNYTFQKWNAQKRRIGKGDCETQTRNDYFTYFMKNWCSTFSIVVLARSRKRPNDEFVFVVKLRNNGNNGMCIINHIWILACVFRCGGRWSPSLHSPWKNVVNINFLFDLPEDIAPMFILEWQIKRKKLFGCVVLGRIFTASRVYTIPKNAHRIWPNDWHTQTQLRVNLGFLPTHGDVRAVWCVRVCALGKHSNLLSNNNSEHSVTMTMIKTFLTCAVMESAGQHLH